MNLGENIARLRKEKNMTQEDLARQINVSFKTISSWENNRNLPNIEMLIDLSKVLDTNIDNILNVDDKVKQKYEKNNIKIKIFNILFVTLLMLIPILYSLNSVTDVLHSLESRLIHNNLLLNNDFENAITVCTHSIIRYCIMYIVFMLGNYILYNLKFKKSLLVLVIIEVFLFIEYIITNILHNKQILSQTLLDLDLWTIIIIIFFGIIFYTKLRKK